MTAENSENSSSASGDPSLEVENSEQGQDDVVRARVYFLARALGEGSHPVSARIRGADSTWQILLDPMTRIDLPLGRFRIDYRIGRSGVWVEAGEIKLLSSREYTAEISKDSIDLVPKG
ncbi:MAG TPA: hypothetical protein ENK31_09205 [Nannocystis exedens]|nr:hypothetical protein [Nannocystis exedens]